MRIDPTRIRIRAVVQAATAKATVSAVAFRASVLVPYIRIRTLLGQFLKFFQITDTVGVSEGQSYFAEDYVEPGYVGAGFFINFTKVITDTVGVSELFGFFIDRAVPDTASMSDSAALTFGTSKADTASAADTRTANFTKIVSDLAALADATALSASKMLADTPTLADVVAISAGKSIIDTATAFDSGFIVMQDYCDFTYFAEDYVGESRAFT